MRNALRSLAFAALAAAFVTPAGAASHYGVDGVHSAALIAINHLGVSTTHGRFNDISGSFVVDDANPANSKINIEIQAGSFDTNNAKRDGHVMSPDFLDAKQFPTITFKSSKVKALDGGDVEVTGKLSLHGVEKTITVVADKVGEGKDPWGGYRCGYDVSFSVMRSDYGMTHMLKGVGDEVRITFALEGIRKDATTKE